MHFLLSDFKAFSWFTYKSNFPPTLFLEFCVMDSICGVDEVCCVATHYLEKYGCGNGKNDNNLDYLLKKGIYCSLISKPPHDLPIRVTSHQLYFLNFVLWTASVVCLFHIRYIRGSSLIIMPSHEFTFRVPYINGWGTIFYHGLNHLKVY